jgi:lysozyme family protein
MCLFDAAVNMGRDKAIRLLQRACGVAQDGVMGGNTIAAANRLSDAVVRFSAERIIAYTGIRGFDTFGKGWLRRTITTALEASK